MNLELWKIRNNPPKLYDCTIEPCNHEMLELILKLQDNVSDVSQIAVTSLLKINQFIYEKTGKKGWFEYHEY